MTFDESNARITEALTGRTISHIVRNGLDIELYCDGGHVVVLASDVNHNICYKRTDVRIMLEGVSMLSQAGKF